MVCNGLRPKFAHDTPDCYVELANQCMNSDPEKRPNISEIITKLAKWLRHVEGKIANQLESIIFLNDKYKFIIWGYYIFIKKLILIYGAYPLAINLIEFMHICYLNARTAFLLI
ncbi:hypothetical protein C2G38_2124469 [Gigaspora rosea]|uniref:Serine-threonine/tyrosine-protein kinase catalytic domain-containing protein n=1 Tax=Gigaspora rosea TaxID=44941 RepID=A0A397TXP0_9GLOM|nr:hypothetical protein C2G38_2124469 [Gigaspora rosea]